MLSTADIFHTVITSIEVFNITLLFAGLVTWKYVPKNFKWIAIYAISIAPCIALNYFASYGLGFNNRFLHHIFLHSDFLLFSLFFHSTLNNIGQKKSVVVFAVIYTLCTVLDYAFLESFWTDNPDNLFFITQSWMLILCLLAYYQIYTEGKIIQLGRSALFWIVTALFFYHSTSFFLNVTNNLWSYNVDLNLYMYFIQNILWFIYVVMLLNFFRLIYIQRNPNK
jgi:hypothetical protein